MSLTEECWRCEGKKRRRTLVRMATGDGDTPVWVSHNCGTCGGWGFLWNVPGQRFIPYNKEVAALGMIFGKTSAGAS